MSALRYGRESKVMIQKLTLKLTADDFCEKFSLKVWRSLPRSIDIT